MAPFLTLYTFLQSGFTSVETRLRTRIENGETGAVAIEYALLASLIAVAIIGMATILGAKIGSVFTFITSKLKDA